LRWASYLLTYAMTRHEPVEWQNGDLVFQNLDGVPNEMILDATASPLTNVGNRRCVGRKRADGDRTLQQRRRSADAATFVPRAPTARSRVYRVRNLTPELSLQGGRGCAQSRSASLTDVFFDKGVRQSLQQRNSSRVAFNEIGFDAGPVGGV